MGVETLVSLVLRNLRVVLGLRMELGGLEDGWDSQPWEMGYRRVSVVRGISLHPKTTQF